VWVLDGAGNAVVQLRSEIKDTYPSTWDVSVAGHLDAGEDAKVCAARECMEEIGLPASPSDLRYAFTVQQSSKGVDKAGNAFLDNEFKDVFTMSLHEEDFSSPGALDRIFTIDKNANEVSELAHMPVGQLLHRLSLRPDDSLDMPFVPRQTDYVTHLAETLKKTLSATA
jgi:isopentenyldiphosphate isomerase